nr:hypothetical protein [uncultured Oscillibacter sp.]
MAKRKKTIVAGRIVKTIIYTAPEPLDGKRARAEKSRMTTAAQKAMNNKTARARLEMLMAANYTGRDLFLTLTYRDADLPSNRAEAVKRLRKFIKTFRTQRKGNGEIFRYIYTTEEKHGESRLHHHLVINGTGADIDTIRSLWPYGDVVDYEYIGSRDYESLSMYLTKESAEGRPVGAQMWTASRNMVKPVVRSSYVSNDTTLSAPLGCHVLEKEERVTEFGSYCYIKYKTPQSWSGLE